ncbi:Rossmann-fold NAD(P)-binding domain-containing protein [Hymenobacter daeguensis]
MNITLTGSLGNIGRPLADLLLHHGHSVTVISSDPRKAPAIEALGATAAIGSVADAAFLTETFRGADAVYTMVPPNWSVPDYRAYIARTGEGYRAAIQAAGVRQVVNLSSVGAHLSGGTGPIAGLYDVEQALDTLDGVTVTHLRPGIFYVNFLFDIPLIRRQGLMGNNYGGQTNLVLAHPRDIAAAAAQELQRVGPGPRYRYVASEVCRAAEAAHVLGNAIGQPTLPWVQFSDADTYAGMTAAGMSPAIAGTYVELGQAIGSGMLFQDFEDQRPAIEGGIPLADFAQEFAAVYQAQS